MKSGLKLLVIFITIYAVTAISGVLFAQTDSDNDGMPDLWESQYSLNPQTDDSMLDYDNDNLRNFYEYNHKTNPSNPDTDNDGITDGDEIAIDTPPTKISSAGKIMYYSNVTSNGYSYFSNWITCNSNWTSCKVSGRKLSPFGTTVGNEISLSNFRIGNSNTTLRTAANKNGCMLVCDISSSSTNFYYQDKNGYGVVKQFIDNDGNPVGNPELVNASTDSDEQFSYVCKTKDGFCVTWSSQYFLFARYYDSIGNPITDEIKITGLWGYSNPRTVCASNGNTVCVVFRKNPDLYCVILDMSGNIIKEPFMINEPSIYADYPAIATDGDNYCIVWEYKNSISMVSGIFINGTGDILSTPFFISNLNTNNVPISIASDGEKYLVVWRNILSSGVQIKGCLFKFNSGNMENLLNIDISKINYVSDLSVSSDGKTFCVVWTDTVSSYNKSIKSAIVTFGYNTNPLSTDTDKDGLTDHTELFTHHTDPLKYDTDSDGLNDYQEVSVYNTSPFSSDTDSDSLPDNWEIQNHTNPLINDKQLDYDNDSLTNLREFNLGTNASILDTDNDGIGDGDEVNNYFTNPLRTDSDNDGLTEGKEILTFHTNPLNKDTDYDNISDYDEIFLHFTNPLAEDTDGDHVPDDMEVFQYHSNPFVADTDNDGLTDNEEGIALMPPYVYNDIPFIYPPIGHSETNIRKLSIAHIANDNSVVTIWTDHFGYELNFLRCDHNGIPIGDKISFDNNYSTQLGAAYNGSMYLIVLKRFISYGSEWALELKGLLLNENGEIIAETTIDSNIQMLYDTVDVVSNGSVFCVLWGSSKNNLSTLKAQLISGSGKIIGEPKIISDTEPITASIACNGESYFITYYNGSIRYIIDPSHPPLTTTWEYYPILHLHFAQLFDSQLNPSSALIELPGYYSKVISDGENFLVTWEEHKYDNLFDISAILFSGTAEVIKNINLITTNVRNLTYTLYIHDIVFNGSTYLITYFSQIMDSNYSFHAEFFAKILNKQGYIISPEIRIKKGDFESIIPPKPIATSSDYLMFYSDNFEGYMVSQKLSVGTGTSPVNPDSDNDGLIDGFEKKLLLTNPANKDTDSDKYSDYHEYIAGTNPLDPQSNFHITNYSSQKTGSGLFRHIIEWQSVAGKTYSVYKNTDSTGAHFSMIAGGIQSQGNTTTYVYEDNDAGFENAVTYLNTEPDNSGEPEYIPYSKTYTTLYKISVTK